MRRRGGSYGAAKSNSAAPSSKKDVTGVAPTAAYDDDGSRWIPDNLPGKSDLRMNRHYQPGKPRYLAGKKKT